MENPLNVNKYIPSATDEPVPKCVMCNRILHWMLDRYTIRKIILEYSGGTLEAFLCEGCAEDVFKQMKHRRKTDEGDEKTGG